MTQFSISAAAPLVGKDRKTLYRMIKEGKLSTTVSLDGEKRVDKSELLRVFGALKDTSEEKPSFEVVSPPQRETVKHRKSELLNEEFRITKELLLVKNQQLEAEMKSVREIIRIREEQIQDLRRSLLLLEGPRQAVPDPAPKGFWTKPRKLF